MKSPHLRESPKAALVEDERSAGERRHKVDAHHCHVVVAVPRQGDDGSFDVRNRALEQRRSGRSARPLASAKAIRTRGREAPGLFELIVGQDIDTDHATRANTSPRLPVHRCGERDEQRIERERAKRLTGETDGTVLGRGRHYDDAGGETADRLFVGLERWCRHPGEVTGPKSSPDRASSIAGQSHRRGRRLDEAVSHECAQ